MINTQSTYHNLRAEQEAMKMQRQQEASEQKQEAVVQMQQLRAVQAEFRAERRGREGFGEVWCIGGGEEAVLEELAANNADTMQT